MLPFAPYHAFAYSMSLSCDDPSSPVLSNPADRSLTAAAWMVSFHITMTVQACATHS